VALKKAVASAVHAKDAEPKAAEGKGGKAEVAEKKRNRDEQV
jgi:hypothetical protein